MKNSKNIFCLMPPKGGWGGHERMFAESWRQFGGPCIECRPLTGLPRRLRAALSRLCSFSFSRPEAKLIIPASWRIDSCAWPWCWRYEIVPMMWDLWPPVMPPFLRFLKRNKVRLVFCTQSQNVAVIQRYCPDVQAIWIPEAIDSSRYSCGGRLVDRQIDLLNYGRSHPLLDQLKREGFCDRHNVLLHTDGTVVLDVLKSFIRNSRCTICYPRCDTHPGQAGVIETLTQRYWECMLSGTLIVGRAPKELIELCGYNPVVELRHSPTLELERVLSHIGDYQGLVDRNLKFARERGDWRTRVPIMLEKLKRLK